MDPSVLPTARPAGSLALTCLSVRDETPSVRTFTFEASEDFPHEAGQAMTLALPVDGETLYRTFSIASAPAQDRRFEMTIKAHPAGRATSWLHRTLKAGDIVLGRRPRGQFTLARRQAERIALVSGGSGATPLLSMLRHLATVEPEADVAWFHAAHSREEILFERELTRLQSLMPRLSAAITIGRGEPGWFGLKGRMTRRLLSVAVPDLAQRDVFCCGPSPFMEEAKLIHAAEGGARESFHTETFRPAETPAAPLPEAEEADRDGEGFELRCDGRLVTVRSHETILQACLRQGIVIACGCGQGMCGTCRIRKISGTVEMRHQGGLDPDEESNGLILACSTRLKSHAEVSLSS
jgi:glycine betaine catabolism B